MSHPTFETPDVQLAAFLRCLDAAFLGVARPSRRRYLYRFAADARLHQLVRLFRSNMPVPLVPAGLFLALEQIKRASRRATVMPPIERASGTAASPSTHGSI
jgi:hypothetical protein